MLTSLRCESSDTVSRRTTDYLRTLPAPTDGMWESAVIPQAALWELQDQGQYAGYYCIDSNDCLLRFHLLEDYRGQAQMIFRWVISKHEISQAITSTVEFFYLSLCLDMQTDVSIHSYLFRDSMSSKLSSRAGDTVAFKRVERSETHDFVNFYRTGTEGTGEWIESFLHTRFLREELFGLYDGQILLAAGECIPSQEQTPYADLGMVVEPSYRRRGLGTEMLLQLKEHCYATGREPICSCAAGNLASKKAIEKAGFISDHRMLTVSLSGNHQRD